MVYSGQSQVNTKIKQEYLMDNAKQQIVDAIKSTDNILVTVSNNPSVDELSAALGLTIILNHLDKRASAVFSGSIPPAISFLEPNKTFEPSAESLRDFIIALDKEKADHLRYKVEGDVVKIFITPYRRVLSEKDLNFSLGDYNVELVIALGVTDKSHLDKSLEAQGKILHSASVVTVMAGKDGSSLGNLDWHDATASSLSEMIVALSDGLKGDKPIFDQQTATALLTGIVSATDRFSNAKTTSRSMTMAAQLMAAGANQQLIAAKLEEAHDIAPGSIVKGLNTQSTGAKQKDNVLTIDRSDIKTSDKVSVSSEQAASLRPESQQPLSPEAKNQKELESQLSNLAASESGTLADIEKQLLGEIANQSPSPSVQAAENNQTVKEPPVQPPAAATLDQATIQGTTVNQSGPSTVPQISTPPNLPDPQPIAQNVAQPENTKAASEKSEQPPSIVTNHGAYTGSSEPPVINGTLSNPHEGEPPSVDPFSSPSIASDELLKEHIRIQPISQDTKQNMKEVPSVIAGQSQPTQNVATGTPSGIPELPPLPPLPTSVDLPPLPLPPPPPVIGAIPPVSLSGPIAGDIFGDGTQVNPQANVSEVDQVKPAEPGQFRIPGMVQ